MVAFPVSSSSAALVFDTLPSLKARYWHLPQPAPKLYAMARCYLLDGALHLSLVSFERTPPAGSRLSFVAAGGKGGRFLLARLGPESCELYLCDAAVKPSLWADRPGEVRAISQPERIAGVDEQGWYWGAQLTVPAPVLAEAGVEPVCGTSFCGALLKHEVVPGAFGASFRLPNAEDVLDLSRFEAFEIVDY